MPALIVHPHVHEDVAGKDALRNSLALPALNLDFIFLRDEYFENLVPHIHVGHALLEVLLHAALMSGISMQHIPAGLFGFLSPVHSLIPQDDVEQARKAQVNQAEKRANRRGNGDYHYREAKCLFIRRPGNIA